MFLPLYLATAFSARNGVGAGGSIHLAPMVLTLGCGFAAFVLAIMVVKCVSIAFRLRRELQPWTQSFKFLFYSAGSAVLFFATVAFYNVVVAPSIGAY